MFLFIRAPAIRVTRSMFTIPTLTTVIGVALVMCGRITIAIRIATITGLTRVTILNIPEDSMGDSTALGDSTVRLTVVFTEEFPSRVTAAVLDLPVLAGEWEAADSTEKPIRHSLNENGGSGGARTRNLCRDRAAL